MRHIQVTQYLRCWGRDRRLEHGADNADMCGHAAVIRRVGEANAKLVSIKTYKEMNGKWPTSDVMHHSYHHYDPAGPTAAL